MTVPRQRLSLHVRAFPGWEALRGAVAAALGLPIGEVRGLDEPADPAVRMEALARALGFRLTIDLYMDPRRATVPRIDGFACALARELAADVAHHDGSRNPYCYVLVHPTGQRFAASEIVDDSDGLHLDESPESLSPLPGLPGGPFVQPGDSPSPA